MLTSLTIDNLALIAHLDIEWGGGLNILTGETGAGKSIVIGALQLILGQRADKSLIRGGAERCEIAATFALGDRPALVAAVAGRLDRAGLPPAADHQLLLRRVLTANSSRAFVNCSPVTLDLLRELGDLLVDVHGPYDHQSLLRNSTQMAVLDAFAGLDEPRAEVRRQHRAWQQAKDELHAFRNESPDPTLVDILRHQVQEIDRAAIRADEEEELVRQHARAANGQEIAELLDRCRLRLSDGDAPVQDAVGEVLRDLYDLERLDPEAGRRFAQTLDGIATGLQELSAELADYAADLDLDGESFTAMEDRLALLRRLKRKYGGDLASVLATAENARARLDRLDDRDATDQRLAAAVAAADKALQSAARKLSRARRQAAADLAPKITAKLRDLGFHDADFAVAVEPAAVGPTGMDAVEFLFAPNAGEGTRPLRAIASSGEISRVMLALKTVLAAADQVPVLIFDEVDANIGGVVAVQVGRELRRLGRDHQVLCITHLPQVAAGGHCHFRVAKATRDGRTATTLEALDDDARVREIARMLGSDGATGVAGSHAAELLARIGAEE